MSGSKFDRAQIRHLATLAALSLSEAEVDSMAGEIEAILRHVDELQSVDTTGVPPTTQIKLGSTAWRDDERREGLTHEDALAGAPKTDHGGFAVPAFVES